MVEADEYQDIAAEYWDLALQTLQEARQRNHRHLDSTIRLIVNRWTFTHETGYNSPDSINRLTMLYNEPGEMGTQDEDRVLLWTPVEDTFDGSTQAWEHVSLISIYHLVRPVLTVAPWSDYRSNESWWSYVEGTWLGNFGTIFEDTTFIHLSLRCECPLIFRITLDRDLSGGHQSHFAEFVGRCTIVHTCDLEDLDADPAYYDFRAQVERHDTEKYLQWNGELHLDTGIIRLAGAQPIIDAVLVAGTRTRLPVEEAVIIRAATWCFWPEGQACVNTSVSAADKVD